MKLQNILKIGNLVEIEVVESSSYEGNYLSKIKDIDDNKIYFSLPTEKGNIIPLRKGERVNVNIVQKDGVYYFYGDIQSRGLKPYMYFTLNYPKKLNRIQRRNYVRVMLNLIVDFKVISDGENEATQDAPIYKGVTFNLSGGGMMFASSKNLEIDSLVEVNFKLTNGFFCEKVIGILRRKDFVKTPSGEKLGYGIEFLKIEDKIRENIISYLFELQRDRRKKGIEI